MRSGWPAHTVALLFALAFAASLFYHGYNVEFLGLAQILLVMALAGVIIGEHKSGIVFPKSGLAITLALFWIWISISRNLSPVPHVSTIGVWWIGTFPLVFWTFTVATQRDDIWKSASCLILIGGLALSVTGAFQLLLQHQEPRALFLNINSYAALLNLIALPVSGYLFVTASPTPRWNVRSLATALALFLLVYGMAITKGRAAAVTFLIGAAFLLFAIRKLVSGKTVVLFLSLVVAAFLLADLSWQGGVTTRLQTLYELGDAGQPRFIIWQRSWEMLQDSPWWGRGLGIYSLAWPPYRDPADPTAGYFVHNDYLQIWIELGVPGLVLFVAVMFSAAWLFVRSMHRTSVPSARRIEAAAIISALLAVALHSALDFNFYILAILIVSGLMLGRLHSIACGLPEYISKNFVFNPSRFLGARAFLTVVVLLAMFPTVYFLSLGLSAHEHKKALTLAGKGELREANQALNRAARLSPDSDNVLMSQADLYRHLLAAAPAQGLVQKVLLFNQAEQLLDRAEQLNRFNAKTIAIRGQLYQENPLLAGERSVEKAIGEYQRALKLDPRFYSARLRYAKLLYRFGRREEARRVAEDGMKYRYYETEDIIPYYAFTARLRFEHGQREHALTLTRTIEHILTEYGWRQLPVPERPMFKVD